MSTIHKVTFYSAPDGAQGLELITEVTTSDGVALSEMLMGLAGHIRETTEREAATASIRDAFKIVDPMPLQTEGALHISDLGDQVQEQETRQLWEISQDDEPKDQGGPRCKNCGEEVGTENTDCDCEEPF
jgi:hypothetical protein